MDQSEPTLLLTRPVEASAAFLSFCEAQLGRRIPVVVSPILRIVDFGELPDVNAFETLVLSSSNAVRRLGRAGALNGRRVATVGEATAALAREFQALTIATGIDSDELVAQSDQITSPAIWCRGHHARGDLAARLTEKGVLATDAVIYDQLSEPLSRAAIALINGKKPIIVPVFSPRSAALLSNAAQFAAPTNVIAMSDATAAAWSGDEAITIVDQPTSKDMACAVLAAF